MRSTRQTLAGTAFRAFVVGPIRERHGSEASLDRSLLAEVDRHDSLACQKIEVATPRAVARLPRIGIARDDKPAAAIDDGQRRLVVAAAPATAPSEDERSLPLAFKLVDAGVGQVRFQNGGLARQIERPRAGIQIDGKVAIAARGLVRRQTPERLSPLRFAALIALPL